MSNWSSRHKYTSENVEKYAPTSGGVYRLVYRSSDDKYFVFYVGQSNSLERRLLEHLSSDEVDKCIRKYVDDKDCYFRYLEVSSESERSKIEKTEIDEYNPACNG